MADSPVLYVYYRPDNDDSYPGVPNRHITEADWARFSPSQRRTVEQATTQEGYTRRKVWLHRDLVDETEQERAEREAREQAAREAYERGQSIVRWRDFEPLVPGPGEVIVGGVDGPVKIPVDSVGGGIFTNITRFGPSLRADDTDDWTGAINTALADLYANGGGTLFFPAGTYRITGQIDVPNSGTPPAGTQPALRLVGEGAWASGRNAAPVGGTILEMRYAGADAKILTRGNGLIEMTGITFRDLGGDSTPFIKTTNTTLHIHHCAFWGSKVGVNADQDCIILGGTNTPVGDADTTPNGSFQGYGTVIEANYFNRIRRGVFFQTYANAVVVQNNTFMHHCGSNIGANAAAIEMLPTAQVCAGNVVTGNLIEMVGYTVGIRATKAERNTFAYNNFYDEGEQSTSEYYFGTAAQYNLVIAGFYAGAGRVVPLVAEDGAVAGRNTVINSTDGSTTVFGEDVTVKGRITGNVEMRTPAADGAFILGNETGTHRLLHADMSTGRLGVKVNNPQRALHVGDTFRVSDPASTQGLDLVKFTDNQWGFTAVGGLFEMRIAPHTVFDGRATIKGLLDHDGTKVGFYGKAPVERPTVTGSKADGTAWESVLDALVALGLVTDSTT